MGIKAASILYVPGAPAEYRNWLAPLPNDVTLAKAPAKSGCDLVHLFVLSLADLKRALPRARAAMKPDGALWVSWYKKAAKIPTDVTEDQIRKLALASDLVDIKVCAVTDIWSGLKLVVPKHLRTG